MSRRRNLRLARTVAVLVLVVVAGFVIAGGFSPARGRPRHETKSHTGKKLATSPHTGGAAPGDENVFVLPQVAKYLATTDDDLTAAVYDEVTGSTSLYRPGLAEDTASIMKVDILATLLNQAQVQNQPLTAEQQALAQEMIEESDDDDAQDLWDAEGGATAVSSFDRQAGLTQTVPDAAGYWGLSTTTAADQVQLLKKVAYPNPLLTEASRSYELDLMTNVDPSQSWGVSAGVPAGVTVAIKNGWLPNDSGIWQINSIGYVDGQGRDYLIAVLSDGNATEGAGIDAIEGLSTLVWQALAPKHVA